jgi:hypothetical protein
MNEERSCELENGDVRKSGESWLKTPCEKCVCINGLLRCTTKECPMIKQNCKFPALKKNSCCLDCIGKINYLK